VTAFAAKASPVRSREQGNFPGSRIVATLGFRRLEAGGTLRCGRSRAEQAGKILRNAFGQRLYGLPQKSGESGVDRG
jgi:hypothetical protein